MEQLCHNLLVSNLAAATAILALKLYLDLYARQGWKPSGDAVQAAIIVPSIGKL